MKHTPQKKLPNTNVQQLTVYLPYALDQWIRDQAIHNGRTLSKQTEILLEAGRAGRRRRPHSMPMPIGSRYGKQKGEVA